MERVHKRIEWIDAVKGLCMLGIMYVHSYGRDETIAKWILSFALPTFLFLTGRVQWEEDVCTFVKRLITKLVIPCIIGLVFLCIFDYAFHYATNDIVLLKDNLLYFLEGNTSVLWFVTALVSIKITYFMLNKAVSKLMIVKKNEVVLLTSFGVAALAAVIRVVCGGG